MPSTTTVMSSARNVNNAKGGQQMKLQAQPFEQEQEQYQDFGNHGASESEVVMMQVSMHSKSNDAAEYYDSQRDQFSFSNKTLEQISNQDETIHQSLELDEGVRDARTVGSMAKAGNLEELDRINRQLAEEYKYVEDLRKNLRIAESRQKALQKAAASTQNFTKKVKNQINSGFVQSNKDSTPFGSIDQLETASGGDLWSESQAFQGRNRKFQLDPPTEKIQDEGGLKSSNSRRLFPQNTKKSITSECTPDIQTISISAKTTGNRNPNTLDNFGLASTEVKQQSSAKKKSTALSANQNMFFSEEYKQNLRKINSNKARSPIVKNSQISQRLAINYPQNQTPSNALSGATSVKSISKAISGAQPQKIPILPSSAFSNFSNSSAKQRQPDAANKQPSFIGSGLFNKGQNQGKPVMPSMTSEERTQQEVTHVFQRSGKQMEALYSLEKSFLSLEEEANENEMQVTENSPDTLLQAPYDFDKYEVMYSQNQLQNLINNKQETPKGSSGSEEEMKEVQKVVIQFIDDNQDQMDQKPQTEDNIFGHSPEPTRKYNFNSMVQKQQRTERKPVSGSIYRSLASIEPFSSVPKRVEKDPFAQRAKQIMSPSRNRPSMMHQQTSLQSGNSFLQNYHELQSPIKTIKSARIEQIAQQTQPVSQPKRNNMFMRPHITYAPQLQSSLSTADANTLQGAPAVPPLRKTKQQVIKSVSTSQTQVSPTFTETGGRQNNAQTRRTRVISPHNVPIGDPQHQATLMSTKTKISNIITHEQVSPLNKPLVNAQTPSQLDQTLQQREQPGQKSLQFVLQFLLQEEEWLDQLQDLASSGNFQEMSAQGLLLPRFNQEFTTQTLYASLFQSIDMARQRPKVFAMQLNIYVVMAALVTELLVLDQPTVRKFASKLDDVLKNCHQNFIIMVDFILSSVGEEIKKSIDYVLLHKVVVKKLQDKVQANRLTLFRQKNDLSRAFLKRIATELKESPISKQAPAIQELCSVILETLRMTVDENGMDISKNSVNEKRVVQKLDLIYDLTQVAIQAMKIASKKAQIKKSQQSNPSERKVKSVMRSTKLPLHSSAQKHASPPPKRYRNAYMTHQNTVQLEPKLQGHLFGAKPQISGRQSPMRPSLTERKQKEELYLQTVEETDNAEASPSKSSALRNQLERSLGSPEMPQEFNFTLNQSQVNCDESTLPNMYARDQFFQENKFFLENKSYLENENDSLTKQEYSVEETKITSNNNGRRQSPKRIKKFGTCQSNNNPGEPTIKHVKTTLMAGLKKSQSTQRQSSASPLAQHRKMSPLKQQSLLLSIAVGQQTQRLNQYPFSSSVLPENLAFILANSGAQVTAQFNTMFSLDVQPVKTSPTREQQPVLKKQQSHGQFIRGDNITVQDSKKETSVGITERTGTLKRQKSTQSQQFGIASQNARLLNRLNTVVTTSPSFEKIKSEDSKERKLQAPQSFSSQINSKFNKPKASDASSDDSESDESSPVIIQRQQSQSQEKIGSRLINHHSDHQQLNPFVHANQLGQLVTTRPTAPFEQQREVSLFKSPRAQVNDESNKLQRDENENEEGISSVYLEDTNQMTGYTSEEDQFDDQNLSLTERGNESLIVSKRQSVVEAAVGAAAVIRNTQQDQQPFGEKPSANLTSIGTNVKDLASESPFEQAQPSNRTNLHKQETRLSMPLNLERLKHQNQHTNVRTSDSVYQKATNDQISSHFDGQELNRIVFQPVVEAVNEDKEFQESSRVSEDKIRVKFEANNFITPRNDQGSKNSFARGALVSFVDRTGEKIGSGSSMTGQTQNPNLLSPNIVEAPKDGEDSMKEYIEETFNAMAGRRSSIRVNSLLFEEDSFLIKREMMRQKQEKYKENKEQRISLQFTAGNVGTRRHTARRILNGISEDAVMTGPVSARNKETYLTQTKNNQLNAEVFALASSLVKNQQPYCRSQSLIDVDSSEAKISAANTVRNLDLEKQESFGNSKFSSDARGAVVQGIQLPLESLHTTTQLRIETILDQENKNQFAIGSPILNSVKIQSPKNDEQHQSEMVTTPVQRHIKFQRGGENNESDNRIADNGVKSAANAELYAFYQSLIPQNSKEKEQAFNMRSKSMVTNFMDIPDTQPSQEDKEEIVPKSSSFSYSNHGTFQTPERGQSSNISPTKVMNNVILENTDEEINTPEQAEQSKSKNAHYSRKDSFQINTFESTDSFVQLESQILQRGDSLVSETKQAVMRHQTKSFPLLEEAEEEYEYEGGVPGGVASSNMIDEEQEQIDAELAELRKNVTIPYLPPIDTAIISEEEVYTLVLDLDETLIHYECDDIDGDYYLIRPGAIKFLKEMALYYEIVVFTAAMPEYADKILDNLDENGFMIKHRLYRQHTTPTEDYAIKDLHLLGRQLERTIIVDNLAENFQATTPLNGIWVESWYDDMQDQVLPRLQKFLAELVEEQVRDVRKYLTQEVKDSILYACLESNKVIPSLAEIRARAGIPEDVTPS